MILTKGKPVLALNVTDAVKKPFDRQLTVLQEPKNRRFELEVGTIRTIDSMFMLLRASMLVNAVAHGGERRRQEHSGVCERSQREHLGAVI